MQANLALQDLGTYNSFAYTFEDIDIQDISHCSLTINNANIPGATSTRARWLTFVRWQSNPDMSTQDP
jgi:hypothetical protein